MTSKEIVYGIHAVKSRLQKGASGIQELWLLQGNSSRRMIQLLTLAEETGVHVNRKTKAEMDSAPAI